MLDKDTDLIYEAYSNATVRKGEKQFEDYFKFEGMQQLDLKGKKVEPLFTLMQPLSGFDLHSTYMGSTIEKRGVNVPSEYYKKDE